MTDPRYVPLGLAAAGGLAHDAADETGAAEDGEIVGADDARADAQRAGADVDLTDASRDSDGTPVGSADAEADRVRAAEEAHGGSLAPGLVDEVGHPVGESAADR